MPAIQAIEKEGVPLLQNGDALPNSEASGAGAGHSFHFIR
jgi:hypothetical protein